MVSEEQSTGFYGHLDHVDFSHGFDVGAGYYDQFPADGSGWTNHQMTVAENSLTIAAGEGRDGSNALRAHAAGADATTSKASIVHGGMDLQAGETVVVSASFHVEQGADLTDVFLLDLEGREIWADDNAHPNQSPGIRLQIADAEGHLQVERGKIGLRDEAFVSVDDAPVVPTGEWFTIDWVVHLSTGADGWSEVYLDGELAVRGDGAVLPDPDVFADLGVELTGSRYDYVETGVTANASDADVTLLVDDVQVRSGTAPEDPAPAVPDAPPPAPAAILAPEPTAPTVDDATRAGGAGDDDLAGWWGDDVIVAGGGDDVVHGRLGRDALVGGAGDDGLVGGFAEDVLWGGAGDDALDGGWCADELYGGSGDDHLGGGRGDDVLQGGAGSDRVEGGAGDDVLVLDWSQRRDSDVDVLDGGAGLDTLLVFVHAATLRNDPNLLATFERLEASIAADPGADFVPQSEEFGVTGIESVDFTVVDTPI